MRRNTFLAALLIAAFTAAGAAGPTHFGEPMPADSVPVPLATALADPEKYAETPHAIQGEITKVCQNKGCWTIIRDGSAWVRVSTGHRYFLPKDARGIAVAYGRLVRKELDADTVAHLNAEGGEAQAQEYGIDALSISIAAGAEGTP